jgi:hypothetical protein
MVYIIVVSTYPPHLAQETGKVYIEAMGKFPDDRAIAKPVVMAAVHTVPEGIRATSISNVKPGKLREALDLYSGRMLVFARLEGFKYTIDVDYDGGEDMNLIGMSV